MTPIPAPIRGVHAQVGSGRRRQPVVIVGAGPYGLSAAAHLAKAGISVRVFGRPMESWIHNMPSGMFLRSHWRASHIADPARELGVDRYHMSLGREPRDPMPLELFVDYGRWFQQHAVPDVDTRRVEQVSSDGAGFELRLDDGEVVSAERVVVATGIVPFAVRPPLYDALPDALVSHAVDHHDLARFAGQRVVVVGSGQSGIESAALLSEAAVDVDLVMRAESVYWLSKAEGGGKGSPALYAYNRIGLGGPRSSWLVANPGLYRRLPVEMRSGLTARCLRPAGAAWLRDRVERVAFTSSRGVQAVQAVDGLVRLDLDDDRTIEADHVLLATGYRVDVSRYAFLGPGLLATIEVRNGFPDLRAGFESSVQGLHFVGAPAAGTFGPIMRFVCGTWASARGLTRAVVGRSRPRAGFSW